MKMNTFIKKSGAVILASALLCSGAATVLPQVTESSIEVSAASYGDYEYTVLGNGTVEITNYNGNASSLSIPGSINGKKVISIGRYAFSECTSLKSVIIPSGVECIDFCAFIECSNLKSIVIPNSVTFFDDYAFNGCAALSSITIPASVTSIGENAFGDCTNLTSINVDSNNKKYASVNGVLFNKIKTELIRYPQGKSGQYTIPGSVARIRAAAFQNCTKLTGITIPESVTYIDYNAFWGCTEIKSVTIPKNIKYFEPGAFQNCTKLSSIKFPDNLDNVVELYLDAYSFYGTAWFKSQPNGILYMNNVAYGYKGDMPKNTSLKIKDGTKYILARSFESQSNLVNVTIPDSVTSIGAYAFSDCTNLKTVTLSNNLTEVGFDAFENTPWYKNQPDGLIYTGKCAYKYKGKMPANTSVTLRSGTKGIAGNAFEGFAQLKSITIPDSVTNIGLHAFSGCTGLTAVTIPKSVKTIGIGAFLDCKNLKSISIPDEIDIGGSLPYSPGAFNNTAWYNSQPNGVLYLGKAAIGYKGTIPENKIVTIKEGTKSIGAYALFGDLAGVVVPSSVSVIGKMALGYHVYGYSFPGGGGTGPRAIENDYVIYGAKGSAAEKYAKDNGFKFVLPVSLNKTVISLGKGETTKLTATGGNGGIKWRTSDSKIITVDQKGNVKAVNNGIAWVTAKDNNGIEKSCKITVKNAPSKITLTKGILTIGVGEKYTLGASVNDGAGCAKRTYRTSNSAIVKMTRTNWNGDFYGVKPGIAYVTVRTYNGKESTCKVTVKAAPTSVTISKKTLKLKVGATATLSCSIPSNAGCALRTFRTSNSNVVKMTKTNWTGSFKAVAPGTAYVTVRTYNGKESTCKVTVTR